MATIGTSYRAPKALRMWLEQITPTDAQVHVMMRDQVARQADRWKAAQQDTAAATRRLQQAVGAHPDDVVWLDHPTAESA